MKNGASEEVETWSQTADLLIYKPLLYHTHSVSFWQSWKMKWLQFPVPWFKSCVFLFLIKKNIVLDTKELHLAAITWARYFLYDFLSLTHIAEESALIHAQLS